MELAKKGLSADAAHRQYMRVIEGEFLNRVQSNKVFLRLLGLLSKRTGMPVEDLHTLVEEIILLCWLEADLTLAAATQKAPMLAEMERLKLKMNACNLTAQKQIEYFKNGPVLAGPLGEDTIIFHEPLKYLDDSTKDLVLSLVLEKVKMIESGSAPPSLVEALANRAKRSEATETSGATGSLNERLESAMDRLADVTYELKEARGMQAESEDEAHKLRRQLWELKEQKGGANELQELRDTVTRQQEEFSTQNAELQELRAKALEHEKDREDEGVRGGGSSSSSAEVQTIVSGQDMADQKKEVRLLKVAIQELQMKIKDLLEKCRRDGLEVDEIAKEMGLEEVIIQQSVFQRLFEDGKKRADKLERIRAQLKSEREKTSKQVPGNRQMRRLILDEDAEAPVMEALEQSQLRGLQNFYGESLNCHDFDPPTPPLLSPSRRMSGMPLQPPPPPMVRAEAPDALAGPWVVTPLRQESESPPRRASADPLPPHWTGSLPGGRRHDFGAVAHAAVVVDRMRMQTSASLPAMQAANVAQRLSLAHAPLQAVVERYEAKPKAHGWKAVRKALR